MQARSALRQRQALCTSMSDILVRAGSVQMCRPADLYQCTAHCQKNGVSDGIACVLCLCELVVRVTLLHTVHTWRSGTASSSKNPKQMACCHSLQMPHLIMSPSSWAEDHSTLPISNQRNSNIVSHLIAITGTPNRRVILCITVTWQDNWFNGTCAFVCSRRRSLSICVITNTPCLTYT